MTTVLFLLCNLLAFSHSAPEPDTHLHVHLPPEGGQGKSPNTGGGIVGNGLRKMAAIDASLKWDPNSPWKCGTSGARILKEEIIGGRVAEPNAFPWMVRIYGGCAKRPCAGALITSKHVLTAYHCAILRGEKKPCDHSDGKRIALMGQNEWAPNNGTSRGITMPITGIIFPKNAGFSKRDKDFKDHDFAIYVLEDPVKFRNDILPICLPPQGASFGGVKAVAAGWGKFALNDNKNPWTNMESPLLKRINLRVSSTAYKHEKMMGTLVEGPAASGKGEWQDPCAGDGGGPLMLPAEGTNQWVVIGTVYGSGYNCKTGQVSEFEGEKVGVWNKVSAQTDWIMKQLGDDADDDDDDDEDDDDDDDDDDSDDDSDDDDDDDDDDDNTNATSTNRRLMAGPMGFANPLPQYGAGFGG